MTSRAGLHPNRPADHPGTGLFVVLVAFLVLCAPAFSGCGSGIAGVASALSGSSGGGGINAAPVLDGVAVFSEKATPAVIQFDLRDAESDPVDVQIRFLRAGDPDPHPATVVDGTFLFDLEDQDCRIGCDGRVECSEELPGGVADTRLDGLATAPDGIRHFKLWDFVADGLGPGRTEGVTLLVEIDGVARGNSAAINPDPVSLAPGNDPPQLKPLEFGVDLDPPLSGIAFVFLTVADTAGDDVVVKVEYRILDDPSCPGWQLTRPAALTSPEDETPCFFVDTSSNPGDLAQEDLEREDYFWQTAWPSSSPDPECALAGIRAAVQLRITVVETLENLDDDPLSVIHITDPFVVDNSVGALEEEVIFLSEVLPGMLAPARGRWILEDGNGFPIRRYLPPRGPAFPSGGGASGRRSAGRRGR